MRVGFTSNSYPTQRNIIGVSRKHTYRRVYDLHKFISVAEAYSRLHLKLPLGLPNDARSRFNDFGLNPVDLIHFYNTISFGKTPWISTFETVVPRLRETFSCHKGVDCSYASLEGNARVKTALEAISSDHCLQIIALSECNLNMQAEMLTHFPEYESLVSNKLTQISPPQKPLVASVIEDDAVLKGELRFIFVGNSFFGKGGREIISALAELRAQDGIDIRLTIVSKMATDTYVTFTDADDVKSALTEMEKHSSWIDYFNGLPNAEVLRLISEAHAGLLPSHADTYGFSVLEYQASACPVITTDIRAFPEINNKQVGWIIEVPKNRLGEALYTSAEERACLSASIHEGLKRTIKEIAGDRSSVHEKSKASLERIVSEHSPEKFAARIEQIYELRG